jgi:M6 family metalloprotease-like protein
MKKIKVLVSILLVFILSFSFASCELFDKWNPFKKPTDKPIDPVPPVVDTYEPLPSAYNGKTFVYDELSRGEGARLYTLTFYGENGYKIYGDGGGGIISEGAAFIDEKDGVLTLKEGDTVVKTEQTPSGFNFSFENKNMRFISAPANSEYVYLSYVGIFSGTAGGKDAVLIIERFFEFFMFSDGVLTKGTYEIYRDGTIEFTTETANFVGTVYKGRIGGEFDLSSSKILTTAFNSSGAVENVEFSYNITPNSRTYAASHGMGEYVLHLLKADVFAIYGPDGLVKAAGTLSAEGGAGEAVYFERNFLSGAARTVEFSYDANGYTFPATTPLLPGSGNIDPETGKGSYFTSGQILQFIRVSEIDDVEVDDTEYGVSGTVRSDCNEPLSGVKIYVNGLETAATNADGEFFIDGLTGIKRVHFEKDDYLFGFYTVSKDQNTIDETGRYIETPLSPHIPPSGGLRQVMPSIGVARPLVLLIDFPDYVRPRFVTAAGVEDGLFNIGNENSLSAFYYKSSYGKLNIDGTVLDWYRTEKPRSAYNDKTLMTEALNYHIGKGIDLSDYDADGDGSVDSLFVIWAGTLDMNTSTWGGAYRSSWYGSPSAWEREVTGYIFVPGSTVYKAVPPLKCNTISLTHETGHLLGLNDYYSYDTETDKKNGGFAYTGGASEGGLGTMDMMDSNLGDHNACSKWLLGWIDPIVVEYDDWAALNYEDYIKNLRPITENGDAIFIKLKPSSDLYTELLVIEAINTQNNGKTLGRLTSPVVRILHVEASLSASGISGNWRGYGFMHDNSYTNIKFISVLEADGEDTILNFYAAHGNDKPNYETKDYFTAGMEITPSTYPNTNAYDEFGNATVFTGLKIKIDYISPNGEAAIRLGYDGAFGEKLEIRSVSPAQYVAPSAAFEYISEDTEEFVFGFNEDIAFASGHSGEDIRLYSGNTRISSGYNVIIDGSDLKISFTEGLSANKDYKVIIPRGVISSLENPYKINDFNYTAGFVTAGGRFVAVGGITFSGGSETTLLGLGKEFKLSPRVIVSPSNATDKTVYFSSSNNEVAVVDEATGVVVSVGYGEAEITVSAAGGITAKYKIKVETTPETTPDGVYYAQMTMGGGELEFKLTLEEDGSYLYERLAGDFAGTVISRGVYGIEGGFINFIPNSGAEFSAEIKVEGGEWSVEGMFATGGGPNFNLKFSKEL